MTSFFVRQQDAKNLLLAPGATSFLFLTTSEGADLHKIIRRLNDFSDVNALTQREMPYSISYFAYWTDKQNGAGDFPICM